MTKPDPFDVFRAAVETPNMPALLHERGELSYRELAQQCALAINWLERKLGPLAAMQDALEPVAVLAEPCVEQIVMTYALVALGLPVLPLHPRLTQAEREALFQITRARLLVTREWYSSPQLLPRHARRSVADPEHVLALVQTSGTSRLSRLACLSRRAFQASAEGSAQRLGWQAKDRWALALPFAHIGGLSILTRCLAARRSVVLVEPDTQRPSTDRLMAAVATHGVSLLSVVPTQLLRLLQLGAWRPPPHLRLTLVGGASVSPEVLRRAQARGLTTLPTYGLTEACSQVCTVAPVTKDARAVLEAGVGRPLAGVDVRLDGNAIEVRGATLFSGYWSEPPHSTDAWFRTGDLGYFDRQGCLHVTGRASELIITGGENVHPAEIEAVVQRVVGTRRICVVGLADEIWGQRVVLAIEGMRDERMALEVAQLVRQKLAGFKRPRELVFLEKFPELPSGKVARRAVAEACSESIGQPTS